MPPVAPLRPRRSRDGRPARPAPAPARQGRRPAGRGWRLVPYDGRDRTLWDTTAIDEAKRLLSTTGHTPPPPGVYQLQAAIALLHCAAPSVEEVNWSGIAGLYTALARLQPSPVVEVNGAVAVGLAQGPHAGLAALAAALDDPRLSDYPPLHAAHADLLERASDPGAVAA